MVILNVGYNETYREFVRSLRMDKRLKDSFVKWVNITKEQQEKYMNEWGYNYYICLDNKTPVGFIGVVEDDLRIAVHPDHRNKGVGSFMLKELQKLRDQGAYPNMKVKVRKTNPDGQRFFTKHKVPFTLVE